MLTVTDAQVAAFRPTVSRLAHQFDWNRWAEFDDLEQEGLIAVWDSLSRGVPPSNTFIKNRMRDWIRKMVRQRFGG